MNNGVWSFLDYVGDIYLLVALFAFLKIFDPNLLLLFKKNLNASKPGRVSKGLGGKIGCIYCYMYFTVIIGVFAHCAVVFLNVFVLRFLSHRGAETPIGAKLPIPVRKLN